MPRLFHATPTSNIPSILADGIQPAIAENRKIKGVWMTTESKIPWAILHTMKRHQTSDVSIVEVKIARSHLNRRWRGIWYTTEAVTTITNITHADTYAASPERD